MADRYRDETGAVPADRSLPLASRLRWGGKANQRSKNVCRIRSILSVSWTPISIAPSDRFPDSSLGPRLTFHNRWAVQPSTLQVPCDPQESVRESLRYSVTASLQVRFAQRVGELYIIP